MHQGEKMCQQLEIHLRRPLAQPVVSHCVPGPQGSYGGRRSCSKLINITVLILFLSLFFCWDAEVNGVLEELCPSFLLNKVL